MDRLLSEADKNKIAKLSFNNKSDYDYFKSKSCWTSNHDLVNDLLMSIVPGTQLVPNHDDEPEIIGLLRFNENIEDIDLASMEIPNITISDDTNSILCKMKPNCCHANSLNLVEQNYAAKMYTGFALCNDGYWWFHSWAIDFNSRIIETTVPKLIYIGLSQDSWIKN